MSRRIPSLMRRGGRSPIVVGGGALPGPLTLSPTVYFRADGITDVSGDVGSWDDEGSAGLRLEALTVGQRPTIVTVGGVTGVQFDATDWLKSTGTIDLSLGSGDEALIQWVAFRMDNDVTADRIIDVEGIFLKTDTGDVFTAEHGGSDMSTTSTYSDGGIYQVTWVTAPTGGTSALYLDGTSETTTAGTDALEPSAREIAMAARATDGAAQWDGTMLEWAIWSAEDTTAFDFTTLHAYGADLISRAGG